MTLDLATLLQGHVFAFLLIFTRIGAIMMSLPGFGENYVPQRARLQLALIISFILLPFLTPSLPAMPEQIGKIAQLLTFEFLIGAFIGVIMRLVFSTLEMAGMIISMQIGLSNAMIFNPALASQGSLTGGMMSLIGIIIIFESGLLEMLMKGLTQSYVIFVPDADLPMGDMAKFVSTTVGESFSLALRLVAPFMILGILFQMVAGVMVKMVPQMQIFFVAAPLQIILGMAIFGITLGSMMTIWAQVFESTFLKILGG